MSRARAGETGNEKFKYEKWAQFQYTCEQVCIQLRKLLVYIIVFTITQDTTDFVTMNINSQWRKEGHNQRPNIVPLVNNYKLIRKNFQLTMTGAHYPEPPSVLYP